jgi:hypothetical protein
MHTLIILALEVEHLEVLDHFHHRIMYNHLKGEHYTLIISSHQECLIKSINQALQWAKMDSNIKILHKPNN